MPAKDDKMNYSSLILNVEGAKSQKSTEEVMPKTCFFTSVWNQKVVMGMLRCGIRYCALLLCVR